MALSYEFPIYIFTSNKSDMSRIASNWVHLNFNRHHKVSPHALIQTIKVMKCSPKYTPREDKNSNLILT